MKRFISALITLSLIFSLSVPAFASEPNSQSTLTPTIISDNVTERIVAVDDAIATYDKISNTVTVTQNGASATISLAPIQDKALAAAPYANSKTTIRSETVWMHEYEYYKTSNTSFFYCIDIPSLNINPNEWCDPITVADNGSLAATSAKKFANLIDAAKDNEVKLVTYGGAIAVSAAVGFISKNMKFTKAAYISALAAAGITVTSNVAGIAGDYINNILNARDEYYAVLGYLA